MKSGASPENFPANKAQSAVGAPSRFLSRFGGLKQESGRKFFDILLEEVFVKIM